MEVEYTVVLCGIALLLTFGFLAFYTIYEPEIQNFKHRHELSECDLYNIFKIEGIEVKYERPDKLNLLELSEMGFKNFQIRVSIKHKGLCYRDYLKFLDLFLYSENIQVIKKIIKKTRGVKVKDIKMCITSYDEAIIYFY